MNNTILNDYIIKALEWLETGGAWIAGEIPIYITELLNWKLWSSGVYMGLGFLFLILAFMFYKLAKNLDKKWKEEWDSTYKGEGWYFLFGTGMFSITGIIVIFVNLLTIVKISVAPRVFLLEYLSKLIRN